MTSTLSSTAGASGEAGSHEEAVRTRYAQAATAAEASLCCPVDYDARYLEVIPDEIIERDYGCGDPSRHVRPGDRVLDLGSGGGKICFIASQVVGPTGRVIGVDMTDAMLELAERHRATIAERIGHDNVEFRKGQIQDLALDLEALELHLAEHPVKSATDYLELRRAIEAMRSERPLVASDSIDVVVSNCVLNLVDPVHRQQLFYEVHRVLDRGGRAVISDIVSDEDVPSHLQADPELWSGCISGAMREDRFLAAFDDAGLYGVEVLERQEEPWAVVDGIEFRSMTVRAWKGKEGPCLERLQSVLYRGPWKTVTDDDGHTLYRGERMAVCDKTYHIYTSEPYADDIVGILPQTEIPLEEAGPFACTGSNRRTAREQKGAGYAKTDLPDGDCCGPGAC